MARLCPECSRLLDRCEAAATEHDRLRADLKKAQRHGKNEIVAVLVLSEAAAVRERGEAYMALRRHTSLEHEEGFGKAASA